MADPAHMLGQLCAEVKGLRADVNDMRTELRQTRSMVEQHRTGFRVFMWLGGSAIALLAALKGVSWK